MKTTLITKKELGERIFDGTGFQLTPVERTTNQKHRFQINGAIKAYSRTIARLDMIRKFELPHMGIRENTHNERVIFHEGCIIYVPAMWMHWNEEMIIEQIKDMREGALSILDELDRELCKDVEVDVEMLEMI